MAKEDMLKIGLALNAIGLMVDDATFKKIKPRLDEIEQIILKQKED